MSEQRIVKGMVLRGPLTERGTHYLWSVRSVRKPLKDGTVKARIVGRGEDLDMDATVVFPGGVVSEPWSVVR